MNQSPAYHPKPDDQGRPCLLTAPSREANLDRLDDPGACLTFVPGPCRAMLLNGVALRPCAFPWPDSAEPPLEEPPFAVPPGMKPAAGAVVVETDGRLWLVAPSNAFGGYQASFPKGRVDPGTGLQATARKEVWEESGLRVALTAWLGDFSRTLTHTRFYLARRVDGHPSDMGWESQAVHLAPADAARGLLNRETDQAVLDAVLRALRRA